MWTRGGRSTRGGVRVIFTQYTSLLADHVQAILSSFVRAIRRGSNSQLVALCDLIMTDIVGKTKNVKLFMKIVALNVGFLY